MYSKRGRAGTLRRAIYEWVSAVLDPGRAARSLRQYPRFLRELRAYRRLSPNKPRALDAIPRLHDVTPTTPFDAHYLYVSAWVMRHLREQEPQLHIDVGGPVTLAACMAAISPTLFIDYRPLTAPVQNLTSLGGDLLHLPVASGSVSSLSCLHVAEHVGLGRYGDPLDPGGTTKACREIARVMASGGSLYFALPVGKPRTHFNAHRVHSPSMVQEVLSDFSILEVAAVDDEGSYSNDVSLSDLGGMTYGCGMFLLRRD